MVNKTLMTTNSPTKSSKSPICRLSIASAILFITVLAWAIISDTENDNLPTNFASLALTSSNRLTKTLTTPTTGHNNILPVSTATNSNLNDSNNNSTTVHNNNTHNKQPELNITSLYASLIDKIEINSSKTGASLGVQVPKHCHSVFSGTGAPAPFDIISNIFSNKSEDMMFPLNAKQLDQLRLQYLCTILGYFDHDFYRNRYRYERGKIDNLENSLMRPDYNAILEIFDKILRFRVFQIGFNKVGTISLHQFFRKNNVPSAHWTVGIDILLNSYENALMNPLSSSTINATIEQEMVRKSGSKHVSLIKSIVANYKTSFGVVNGARVSKNINDTTGRIFANPWYLDTFMFYSDFGTKPFGCVSIFPFFYDYSIVSSVAQLENKYIYMDDSIDTGIGRVMNNTVNIIYDSVMAATDFTKDNYRYQTATNFEIFDANYNQKCYFILNIRNVYHWLLSRVKHNGVEGQLLKKDRQWMGKFLTKVHHKLKKTYDMNGNELETMLFRDYNSGSGESSSTNGAVNVVTDAIRLIKTFKSELTDIDIIKTWYLDWYYYICNVVNYFGFQNSLSKSVGNSANGGSMHDQSILKNRLFIFDIEKDSIDDLVEYFGDLIVLDRNKWSHAHKTKTNESLSGKNSSKNRIQNNYNNIVVCLTQFIDEQLMNKPDYSEKEFILNEMCPTYFWNENNIFKYQIYDEHGIDRNNYRTMMNLEHWNEFFGYLSRFTVTTKNSDNVRNV